MMRIRIAVSAAKCGDSLCNLLALCRIVQLLSGRLDCLGCRRWCRILSFPPTCSGETKARYEHGIDGRENALRADVPRAASAAVGKSLVPFVGAGAGGGRCGEPQAGLFGLASRDGRGPVEGSSDVLAGPEFEAALLWGRAHPAGVAAPGVPSAESFADTSLVEGDEWRGGAGGRTAGRVPVSEP